MRHAVYPQMSNGQRFDCTSFATLTHFYFYSVAVWLSCWTQAQKARVQIAVATLSSNSLRQTIHTHRASVHQAAKFVAAFCRPGEKYWQPTAEFMTHVTCRLTAKYRDQLGNRVCATFTLFFTARPRDALLARYKLWSLSVRRTPLL